VRLKLLDDVDPDEVIRLASQTLEVMVPFHSEIHEYAQRIAR
jgi:hypothetical protein